MGCRVIFQHTLSHLTTLVQDPENNALHILYISTGCVGEAFAVAVEEVK